MRRDPYADRFRDAAGVVAESETESDATPEWTETCGFIQHVVAAARRVDIAAMRSASRRAAPIAFARQIAMYLAHVACGLTLTEVGRGFARDRTTVAHACRLVEDRRDRPEMDLALDYLEAAIAEWVSHARARAGWAEGA